MNLKPDIRENTERNIQPGQRIMELSEAAKQARREYNRERNREWRERNPKKAREAIKRWRERNPDKQKEYMRNFYERKAREMESCLDRAIAYETDTVKDVSVTSRVSVTETAGQKVCLTCGEFYTPKRSTARYCSDRCRVKRNRQMLR